jgi:hypothetical protein
MQEVTHAIYMLMSRAGWWNRYVPSKPGDQAYFTVILYRKGSTTSMEPFEQSFFRSSIMGEQL